MPDPLQDQCTSPGSRGGCQISAVFAVSAFDGCHRWEGNEVDCGAGGLLAYPFTICISCTRAWSDRRLGSRQEEGGSPARRSCRLHHRIHFDACTCDVEQRVAVVRRVLAPSFMKRSWSWTRSRAGAAGRHRRDTGAPIVSVATS